MLRNKRSHCNEKPVHRNEDPTQPKINKLTFKKKEEGGLIIIYSLIYSFNKYLLGGSFEPDVGLDAVHSH